MDIVVRTPHGVADVAIGSFGPTATLQDLLRLVTGQAVPAVADLDGRAIDTETPIAAAGLLIGSIIETGTAASPPPESAVALLQLAGPGAGTIRTLAPGRYRLGPGRRLTSAELEMAPVEITALELTVGDDGSVEVRSGYSAPVLLNGQRITEAAPWQGGMLTIGRRVFAIESPPRPMARRQLGVPDGRGIVTFNRPPRSGDDGPRQLVVDAVRDAVGARPTLWRQRAGDLTAFTLPIGMAGDPPGPITIDLAAERGVAIVGTEAFTTGLARTVLVESATLHGPADLDVAIATSPDRLDRWDWAKWLPHLRDAGTPQFLSDESHLHEWVARLHQRAVDTAGRLSPSHLTVLVVDDPNLWTERASPLMSLLSSHPTGLRLLALADREANAPATCTAIISERDGLAHLSVPDRGVDVGAIIPALTEVGTATTVARHLAPLDDTERPVTDAFSAEGPESLAALLDPLPTETAGIIEYWRTFPDRLQIPLGVSAGQRVSADVGPADNILVTAARPDLAADVAIGIVYAMATQLPPHALSIVHVATRPDAPLDAIDDLPHFAGRFDEPGAAAAKRLILRLAHAAGGFDPNRRVVVVLDGGRAVAPGLTAGLVELSRALPALQLLMTTDDLRPDPDRRGSFPVQITIHDANGSPRGSLRIDAQRVHRPFVPYSRPGPNPRGLSVHPVVFGRTPTSLERRLDLLARRGGPNDAGEFRRLAEALTAAADLASGPPAPLVPRPLPPLHRSETLLAERAGDAIPLGLVDLPERLETAPLWWQPGRAGTLLFLGSPRSGVDAALSTIILGVAARFSPDDLHLYCIDPLNRRRAAAGSLPHAGAVTTPDDVEATCRLLGWLAAESERRLGAGSSTIAEAPALLLLIHDLGRLRRQVGIDPDLDRWLAAIARAGPVDVNLVATAYRVAEAGPLIDVVADRLVGAMADGDDYGLLGVLDPLAIEQQLGRCWSTSTDRMVQLALPPVDLAGTGHGGPPLSRPPARPLVGGRP